MFGLQAPQLTLYEFLCKFQERLVSLNINIFHQWVTELDLFSSVVF